MKHATEIERARKQGYEPRIATDGVSDLAVVYIRAPLAPDGQIRYILVAPAGWFCNECGTRVTPAEFTRHARGRFKKGHGA
ncbi:hypothetical protein SEA_SKOG_40 [Gordonia phage Skog]|uniref:Uncharacterized protein n=1 Tax=Gordonia phage Skog TaxID=2704033 RepID=A0A6G6XJB5_9CAUD|nr:hypothetical protein KHQ85_gp040 [Gordonia phage Skog]QIG58192.1 hypothetical protein SEA_SKOG_40 [Gordonia phage Skog]